MTMIAKHGATVLPFRDALLLAPKQQSKRPLAVEQRTFTEDELPDNVVVLARFARRARRPYWLGGPPEGEAA
jgi:hypothetical protein